MYFLPATVTVLTAVFSGLGIEATSTVSTPLAPLSYTNNESQCIASARRSFDQEKKKIKKRHLKRMKRCLAVPGRTRNDCYWLRKLTRSGHRVNRKNLKNTIEDCDSPTASPTDATSDSPTGSPTFPPTASPSAVPSDVPSGLPSDAPASPTDAPSDSSTLSPSSEICFNNADIVTAVTEYFDNKDAAEIKYGGIGSWATCRVTTFEYLFAAKDNGYYDGGGGGYYENESYSSDDEFNYYEGSDDSYSEKTFNQDLNDWDLSSVTSLHLAFKGTETFNGRISNWDVSLVENFRQSFDIASAFNQNISDWDVSSSSTFYGVFFAASSFNQYLEWDVSSSSDFYAAFGYASSFNQCLEWSLMEGADTNQMFQGSPGRLGPCGSS